LTHLPGLSEYRPAPKIPSAQFGARFSPSSSSGFMQRSFSTLEKNPIAETLAKDVLGFNLPKFALSRTFREFLDILPIELGNTAITAASTVLLPPLLRYPVKHLSGIKDMRVLATEAGKRLSSQAKLARLGVAFGFAIPFAAGFWALPFFRNWLTIKNLKTASFESLITGGTKTGHQHRTLDEEAAFQLKRTLQFVGIGVGLGALSILGFSRMARQVGSKPMSKGLNTLFKMFDLKGKNANQIDGKWPTFLFWSAPAYLGWIHAARGSNERREQAIKGLNSCAWFFLVTPLLNRTWFVNSFNQALKQLNVRKTLSSVPSYETIRAQYKGPVREKLLGLKNRQYGISFVITILMLSMSPQILNIFLTKKRLESQQKQLRE
jgi:hypothetical protein